MFKALLKKDFIESFGAVFRGQGKQARRQRAAFVAIIVMAVLYGGMVGVGMWSVSDVFFQQNLAEPYLTMAAFAVLIFMLLLGITSFLSNLLFSDDMAILQRLPITFHEIILSKLAFNALQFFPIAVVVLGPASVAFGLYGQRGPLYYMQMVLGILAFLTIVQCLLLFVCFLLMKPLMRLKRPKDVLGYVNSGIGILFFIGIQAFTQTADERGGLSGQLVNLTHRSYAVGRAFPPTRFYTNSLLRPGWEGLSYTLLLVGLAAILVYLVTRWSAPLFDQASQVEPVTGKRQKRDSWKEVMSPHWAIVKKDVREILETPAFMTQLVMMGLVMPLVIGFFAIRREWSSIYPMVASVWTGHLTAGQVFLMSVVYGVLAGIALNFFTQFDHFAYSREGGNMWQLLSLPIEAKEVVRGKYMVNLITGMGSQLLMLVVVLLLLKAPALVWLGTLLGCTLFSLVYAYVGLIADGTGPKLDWKDPRQIGQNNFHPLLYFFLEMAAFAGMVAGIGFALWQDGPAGVQVRTHRILPVTLATVAALLVLWAVLRHLAVRVYEKNHMDYLD